MQPSNLLLSQWSSNDLTEISLNSLNQWTIIAKGLYVRWACIQQSGSFQLFLTFTLCFCRASTEDRVRELEPCHISWVCAQPCTYVWPSKFCYYIRNFQRPPKTPLFPLLPFWVFWSAMTQSHRHYKDLEKAHSSLHWLWISISFLLVYNLKTIKCTDHKSV